MKRLARFNWYALLFCFLVFATGGTMACLAALVLSAMPFWGILSIALGLGLYAAAGCAIMEMERC